MVLNEICGHTFDVILRSPSGKGDEESGVGPHAAVVWVAPGLPRFFTTAQNDICTDACIVKVICFVTIAQSGKSAATSQYDFGRASGKIAFDLGHAHKADGKGDIRFSQRCGQQL